MSYPHTDVLCCFPGIGRTTFSAEQNKEGSTFCLDLDYDRNLAVLMARVKVERAQKAYRYILLPMDEEVLQALRESLVPHLVIVPNPDEFDVWAKRWLHGGSSAGTVIARRTRWREIYNVCEKEPCVIRLLSGDWLGNILEQTRASAEDGKDV